MSGQGKGIIKTKGLTKYYGSSPGVEGLDLNIDRGEIFGFLGPNGAGKTTTIRLLLGLLRPTGGSISILGVNIAKDRLEVLRKIGYLPGDVGLYKDMTGAALLNHFLKLRENGNASQHKGRLVDLTERFKIDFQRKIAGYSKGMRQIVGILQAFMHDPDIYILDEPTSGLDPIMQERFYDLLLNERGRGKTVFLSTHILGEAERVCDRVGIIKRGRLVFTDEIAEYRSLVGKNIKIVTTTGANGEKLREKLKALPGIETIEGEKEVLEFHYRGDIQKLLQLVSSSQIKDFTSEIPKIEDLFFKYYRD
jgi:ABC-2 type transport system ATP-binding protein